jgi:hypothetical protein
VADDDTNPPDGDPPADGGQQQQRTFTQTELDAIVERRLAKERAKYADYDDLKAAAGKLTEIEDAQRSDLERAQQAAQDAQARAEQAEARAREVAIRSALTAQAATAGVVDIDAAIRLVDLDGITVGDDGSVTGADTAVAALLESKPFLKAQQAPPSFDGGARGDGTGGSSARPWQVKSRDDLVGKSPDEINALREGGHLNELLGIQT